MLMYDASPLVLNAPSGAMINSIITGDLSVCLYQPSTNTMVNGRLLCPNEVAGEPIYTLIKPLIAAQGAQIPNLMAEVTADNPPSQGSPLPQGAILTYSSSPNPPTDYADVLCSGTVNSAYPNMF